MRSRLKIFEIMMIVMFFGITVNEAVGQDRIICASGIKLSKNGTQASYDLINTVLYNNPLPSNLGNVSTLILDSVRHIMTRNTCSANGPFEDKFMYRIYKVGATPGAFISFPTPGSLGGGATDVTSLCTGGTGYTSFFKFGGTNINLLTGLNCGEQYTLEMKNSTDNGGACKSETNIVSTTFTFITNPISSNGICYASLQAALTALEPNVGTITVHQSLTNNANIVIPSGATISLATGVTLINASTITNNGTINGTFNGTFINNGGATYGGNGNLIGNLTNNGTVAPGAFSLPMGSGR
jgi:hypothetical protein